MKVFKVRKAIDKETGQEFNNYFMIDGSEEESKELLKSLEIEKESVLLYDVQGHILFDSVFHEDFPYTINKFRMMFDSECDLEFWKYKLIFDYFYNENLKKWVTEDNYSNIFKNNWDELFDVITKLKNDGYDVTEITETLFTMNKTIIYNTIYNFIFKYVV